MSKFHLNFWSENGIAVLNTQHQKSNLVISDLISLLESRIQAEEAYASKLDQTAAIEIRSGNSGLIAYQEEIARTRNSQKNKAENLRRVVADLKPCIKDHSGTAKEIDILAKSLDKLLKDIDALSLLTRAKYQKADDQKQKEPIETIGSLDLMINIGSVNMTAEEFNNTCFSLQKDAQMEDVKGFLMVTKDCYLIDSVLALLSKHLEIDYNNANVFLNDLISKGYLNKVDNSHVKWKKMYMDNEKPSKTAKRDADITDLEYKRLVQVGQKTRIMLEKKSVEFMKKVEQEIRDRVKLIKSTFKLIMDIDAPDGMAIEQSKKRLEVFLEMMDPDKETLMVVEQFRTGYSRFKPIIYNNHYTGSEVIFGVPLDQTTLEVISDHFSSQIGVGYQVDAWINYDIDHEDVLTLINLCDSGNIHRHVLKKYPIAAVIGLLSRYLLDLPNSLCSDEIYDPLKILYLSKADDQGAMRLNSLRSVLSSMPSSHFHALLYITKHWVNMVQSAKPDEQTLNELSVALGPIILRPQKETKLTLHDKHPSRLAKDLLVHFDAIFSLDVLSTQTSMDDLEASLRESLDGSPMIDSHEYFETNRKFSEDSEPANTIAMIDKQLREIAESQEPTPTEKEPAFEIGEA